MTGMSEICGKKWKKNLRKKAWMNDWKLIESWNLTLVWELECMDPFLFCLMFPIGSMTVELLKNSKVSDIFVTGKLSGDTLKQHKTEKPLKSNNCQAQVNKIEKPNCARQQHFWLRIYKTLKLLVSLTQWISVRIPKSSEKLEIFQKNWLLTGRYFSFRNPFFCWPVILLVAIVRITEISGFLKPWVSMKFFENSRIVKNLQKTDSAKAGT